MQDSYYWRNRERLLAKQKERWASLTPEQKAEKGRQKATSPSASPEARKAAYAKNAEKIKAQFKARYPAIKDAINAKRRSKNATHLADRPLYVIGMGDINNPMFVKIGVSKTPEKRLQRLQEPKLPWPLHMLLQCPQVRDGTFSSFERDVHALLDGARANGSEWFAPTDALLEWLAAAYARFYAQP